MENKLKKIFLMMIIAVMVVTALIAIYIFIFSQFHDPNQIKIMGTNLYLGVSSILALCCSLIFNRKYFKYYSLLGISIIGVALIYNISSIWVDDFYRYYSYENQIACNILSVSFAYTSLLFLVETKNKIVNTILYTTVVIIFILTGLSIWELLYPEQLLEFIKTVFHTVDTFVRLIGVLSVLGVLGTIVLPIINKYFKYSNDKR